MSTRRLPSPRLATAVAILGTALAYGTIAAMGACSASTSASPAGVHVIVTMSDADWDDQHAFDHLTVTARVAERRDVGCLYPEDSVDGRAVKLDEEPQPTSCADHRTQKWTGRPTADGWKLETKPRTINVEAAEGEAVEIDVIGGFGGRLGTVRGHGVTFASSAYPDLRIELTAGEPVFPNGCGARLESSFPEGLKSRFPDMCDAEECSEPGSLDFRSPAVFCVDTDGGRVSRVRNEPGPPCLNKPDATNGLVWRKHFEAENDCARVFTTGRFVRCMEGDDRGACEVTTYCTPPSTVLGVKPEDAGPFKDLVDVACLPPMGVPITWSVTVYPEGGPVEYGVFQDPKAAEPGSCFLDVYEIASQSCDSP